MELDNLIERVKRDRPGEATEDELLTWVGQLDTAWLDEVICTHEPGEEYDRQIYFRGYMDAAGDETLMIPPPDDEVYIHWLYAKIDYRLGEMERYNNDMAMFNTLYSQAAKRYNRQHLPLGQRLRHAVYGHWGGQPGADDPLDQRNDWTRS